MSDQKPVIIVMGVTGAGKTTLGRALAERLAVPFYDGDDFHSAANLKKMSAGTPLTDEDREPWLTTMRSAIDDWLRTQQGGVLACSALKRHYRDLLEGPDRDVLFFYLKGTPALLRSRLSARAGHFMPAVLLQSQLDALEPPVGALTLDISLSTDTMVDLADAYLKQKRIEK